MGEHPANIADLSPQERALIAELRSSGKSLEEIVGDAVDQRLAQTGLHRIDPLSGIAIAAASPKDALDKHFQAGLQQFTHPFVITMFCLVFGFIFLFFWIAEGGFN